MHGLGDGLDLGGRVGGGNTAVGFGDSLGREAIVTHSYDGFVASHTDSAVDGVVVHACAQNSLDGELLGAVNHVLFIIIEVEVLRNRM